MKSKYSHSPAVGFISPLLYWSTQSKEQKIQWKKGETIKIGIREETRRIVVDFGKEVGGYLRVHWGNVRGGAIKFYFSESLEELEPRGDIVWEHILREMPFFCQHIYRGSGNEWWRAKTLRGGFRYLLVKPDFGVKAEIKDIEIESDFYIPENGNYPGFFECSDKDLNRIWYAAAYTMQVATKHPWESFVFGKDKAGVGEWVIFDGAKRDRTVWGLDLAICIPSYLYSLWNPSAVKNSLLTLLLQKEKGLYALKRGYIPHSAFPTNRLTSLLISLSTFSVYVMWWIRGVYFYYLHTGDREFVESVFGDVIEALRWLETQTRKSPESRTPLFFARGLNDLSWDYTIYRLGFSGATNLVWAKTLEEASWLAERVMDDKKIANDYKKRAIRIRKAVFESGFKPYNLWDRKLGRFRHTTMENSPFTHEVNAQAVYFDFVTGKKANELLNLIRECLHTDWGPLSSDKRFPFILQGQRHSKKVMPSLAVYEIAGLMKHNRYSEAVELTKKTFIPMLEQGTGTTFWEWYGENGKIPGAFASLCHPWSSWILQVLNENLTGIKPIDAGFSQVELNPKAMIFCTEIKNASFHIPTPKGIIKGEWYRNKKGVVYKAELPEEIEGKLTPTAEPIIYENIKGKKLSQIDKFNKKIRIQFKVGG